MTPTYNGVDTNSVDAFRATCTNSSGATQPEYFADHMATASIYASLIDPRDQQIVYIDAYTIDYLSSADSPGAPLIQSDTRANSISFGVSSATPTLAATVTLELVDLIRKNEYTADVKSAPSYLNNYAATYTFKGHNRSGAPFTFTSRTNFQIGPFNYCPPGFQPM